MQFEYLTKEWLVGDPLIQNYMNRRGKEGWELVSVIPFVDSIGKKWEKYFFKRKAEAEDKS